MTAKKWDRVQIELVKCKHGARDTGTRIAMIFEGRDAAKAKGGTIARFVTNSEPTRHAHVRGPAETHPKPKPDSGRVSTRISRFANGRQATCVFFRPLVGTIAGVRTVFGFCTDAERAAFFRNRSPLEKRCFGYDDACICSNSG